MDRRLVVILFVVGLVIMLGWASGAVQYSLEIVKGNMEVDDERLEMVEDRDEVEVFRGIVIGRGDNYYWFLTKGGLVKVELNEVTRLVVAIVKKQDGGVLERKLRADLEQVADSGGMQREEVGDFLVYSSNERSVVEEYFLKGGVFEAYYDARRGLVKRVLTVKRPIDTLVDWYHY